MNTKTQGEGLRERIEAQVRDVFADCDDGITVGAIMQAVEMHLPPAPAIAPAGDDADKRLAAAFRDLADRDYAHLPAAIFIAHVNEKAAAPQDGEADQPVGDDARDAMRYRWLRAYDNADLLAEDVIDEAIAAAAGDAGGRE